MLCCADRCCVVLTGVVLCRQVEQMLGTEDHGKDLASVTNLLKKHQLMEADIAAHDVRYLQLGSG